MIHVITIFKKQLKDTFKNKTVLIQFIMFPVLTLVMNCAIQINGMPKNFFVSLFAVMYIGMAPLSSIAAIIAEEKEKNTLRLMLMSNVKPHEYLIGIGSYVWTACMLGAVVICAAGSYTFRERVIFMVVMTIGILASLLAGAAIGTWSKTQMMATSITLPVMMVFSFMPMLSMFNTTIADVARVIYSVQISRMLNQISSLHPGLGNMCIVAANLILFTALFSFAYKKCGLE